MDLWFIPATGLPMDGQPFSHVLARGWRRQIWRKIFLLHRWTGLKDSCLSPSAQRWNEKCKHHYHFQKTAITSFFSGNVDQSRETSPRKDRWSFQLFWQIISVPLLSAWAAVVDVSFIVSIFWHNLGTQSVSALQLLTCNRSGTITWSEVMTADEHDVTAVTFWDANL